MDDIERYLDHFDETRVQIRFVDMPDELPDRVWLADFFAVGDQAPPRDDIVRDIELALIKDGPPIAHTLDISRSHYDWGASAAMQDIVVQVANQLIEEGWNAVDTGKVVAGGGLKLLWDSWRTRKRVKQDLVLLEGSEEAEAAARERVQRVYRVPEESLTLLQDIHAPDEGRWAFTFQDANASYTVSLAAQGEDLITSELSRTLRTS